MMLTSHHVADFETRNRNHRLDATAATNRPRVDITAVRLPTTTERAAEAARPQRFHFRLPHPHPISRLRHTPAH